MKTYHVTRRVSVLALVVAVSIIGGPNSSFSLTPNHCLSA